MYRVTLMRGGHVERDVQVAHLGARIEVERYDTGSVDIYEYVAYGEHTHDLIARYVDTRSWDEPRRR